MVLYPRSYISTFLPAWFHLKLGCPEVDIYRMALLEDYVLKFRVCKMQKKIIPIDGSLHRRSSQVTDLRSINSTRRAPTEGSSMRTKHLLRFYMKSFKVHHNPIWYSATHAHV
jgi:hypothetical protein